MGGETKTVTTIKLFKRIKEAQVGIYRYDDPDKMDHASWPLATVTIEKGGWENKKKDHAYLSYGREKPTMVSKQIGITPALGGTGQGELVDKRL